MLRAHAASLTTGRMTVRQDAYSGDGQRYNSSSFCMEDSTSGFTVIFGVHFLSTLSCGTIIQDTAAYLCMDSALFISAGPYLMKLCPSEYLYFIF